MPIKIDNISIQIRTRQKAAPFFPQLDILVRANGKEHHYVRHALEDDLTSTFDYIMDTAKEALREHLSGQSTETFAVTPSKPV